MSWVMGVVEDQTTTAAGVRTGASFGRYRLGRLLGTGGYGQVYAAEDTEMNRVVALKLMAAQYSHNEGFRERLYREARTAGRLHEPHVVPIHHCGEIDGQLYIDMRLIEGTDLQRVLARDGSLRPARAVAIARQIASALDAAHADNVIHRDVKPANILLTGDDFACLVDFGLANAATDARLTSAGTTIGTFSYMAPERLNDAEVTHRADIYALACVLYECLTGSPPYAAGELTALITAHLTAPIPRPSQLRPQLPAGFDEVIARGMAKNPEDRYGSAGELATAAHHALAALDQHRAEAMVASARDPDRGQPATTTPPPPSPPTSVRHPLPGLRLLQRHRRVAITLAALALVAVMATVIVGHRSSQPPAPRAHPPQVELPFNGLNGPHGVVVSNAGDVYVADLRNNRVLKLPAGSKTPAELPFANLNGPWSVDVDNAGNVYVTDYFNNRVLKLPAASNTPVELPFTGVTHPWGVVVDTAGNVYVSDDGNNRVLELPAGSNAHVELLFTGLLHPGGVEVDAAGNVYVADRGNNRVLELPAGSNTQVELPFTGLRHPGAVAVASTGDIYICGGGGNRVLKLPAGSNTQVELPFTGLSLPSDVAVDTHGDVYVADAGNDRVLKLPAR